MDVTDGTSMCPLNIGLIVVFTHGQHGRGQQPPGEELQEDNHHRVGDFGSASAVLQREETHTNVSD